jgi:hypothetical protein
MNESIGPFALTPEALFGLHLLHHALLAGPSYRIVILSEV